MVQFLWVPLLRRRSHGDTTCPHVMSSVACHTYFQVLSLRRATMPGLSVAVCSGQCCRKCPMAIGTVSHLHVANLGVGG